MHGRRGRPPHPEPVTPGEARVLELVRDGRSNAEIAVRLGISINTVRYHVSNLLAKANATDRAELKQWCPPAPPARALGWWALLVKPAIASVAVAAVGAVALAGTLTVKFQPDGAPSAVESPEPFQGAVVGELIRQGSSLAVIESSTGQAFVLTEPLHFGRFLGRTVFLVGEIDGRQIAPAAGTVVGPLARCSGVLTESAGVVTVDGVCKGMEVVGLSVDQLVALRSEHVVVNVLACTESTGGRLSNPSVSLYSEQVAPRC